MTDRGHIEYRAFVQSPPFMNVGMPFPLRSMGSESMILQQPNPLTISPMVLMPNPYYTGPMPISFSSPLGPNFGSSTSGSLSQELDYTDLSIIDHDTNPLDIGDTAPSECSGFPNVEDTETLLPFNCHASQYIEDDDMGLSPSSKFSIGNVMDFARETSADLLGSPVLSDMSSENQLSPPFESSQLSRYFLRPSLLDLQPALSGSKLAPMSTNKLASSGNNLPHISELFGSDSTKAGVTPTTPTLSQTNKENYSPSKLIVTLKTKRLSLITDTPESPELESDEEKSPSIEAQKRHKESEDSDFYPTTSLKRKRNSRGISKRRRCGSSSPLLEAKLVDPAESNGLNIEPYPFKLDNARDRAHVTPLTAGETDTPRKIRIKRVPALKESIEKKIRGLVSCGSDCGEKFSSCRSMVEHLDKAHARTYRPHLCPEPECIWSILGFHKVSECTRHYRSQHCGPIYVCSVPGCEKKFFRSDSCRRHIRMSHMNPNSRFNSQKS